VAGLDRFHRRVRVQGNRPRASRLKARGAEQNGSGAQEMRPGAAVLQEATRVWRPWFSSTRV
jgi:hypothetical protein